MPKNLQNSGEIRNSACFCWTRPQSVVFLRFYTLSLSPNSQMYVKFRSPKIVHNSALDEWIFKSFFLKKMVNISLHECEVSSWLIRSMKSYSKNQLVKSAVFLVYQRSLFLVKFNSLLEQSYWAEKSSVPKFAIFWIAKNGLYLILSSELF